MPRTRSTTVVASPAAAAETAVCNIPQISLVVGDVVDLFAALDLTIGTAGTTVTLKLERGTAAAGTLVATFGPFTVTATNRYNFACGSTDVQATEQYGQQYVLTVTVANASAASTVNAVYLGASY